MILYKRNTVTKDVLYQFIKCNNLLGKLSTKNILRLYLNKVLHYAEIFEAWNQSELIGFIAVYLNRIETKTSFITYFATALNSRRQKVATQMLESLCSYAKEMNFCYIDLEVEKSNLAAITFYKKHNFVVKKLKSKTLYMQKCLI